MFAHLSKLFSSKSGIFAYIVLILLAWGVWWYFTDVAVMFGNYGVAYTSFDIALSLVMVLGFPLFLVAFWYKSSLFWRDTLDTKSGTGMLGWILGTIISGASCCGLTLASYFGLLPLMNLLPYNGIEIKIVATLGLLYALYDILKNLEACKMKKK